jgi:hypothetical protein
MPATSFFCHSFCKPTQCSTFIFSFGWIDFLEEKEKNKRAAPPHKTKTYAQKNWWELSNITWHYRTTLRAPLRFGALPLML